MVDISKKTVALLLILAIVVSATTTLISLTSGAEGGVAGGVTEDTKGAMVQVNVLPPPKGAQVQVEVVEKGDTNE